MLKYHIFFSLIFLLFITSCQNNISNIHAEKGKIKLDASIFEQQTSVELQGEWEFYWKKLLNPTDFKNNLTKKIEFIKVPSSWTSTYATYGYATYRINIEFKNKNIEKDIGLFVPKIWSATKIWANNKLILERGKIDSSFKNYENQMVEKIIPLYFYNDKLEIVVQVANYDMFVSGLIQNFRIGEYEKMIVTRNLMNGLDLIWLGCLFLMSVYHFTLYVFRKNNKSTLYFGLACLMIGLRIIVFGEHYFYQYLKENNFLNFEWQAKIYYISSFLMISTALLYIHSLYPKQNKKIITNIFSIILGIYCVFILISPPYFFLSTINIFEIVSVLAEIYLIYVLILATIQKQDDAILQMIGIILMTFASINDTLHAEEINLVGAIELMPIMFVIFLLLQIFVIARRFSKAFKDVEDLSKNLDTKVKERTLALEKAKEEIEEKNKHITDSILSAQRIQEAILPVDNNIRQFLKSFFILFKPRDIVSGDFYYFEEVNQKLIISTIDCTGHGVPGALMSMLAKDILNNIVLEKKILESDKILNELHKGIRLVLKQGDSSSREGMDLSLLVIDKENKIIEFSGAKNQLIYIQNNKLEEIKADKISIGGEQKEEERFFTKNIIDLKILGENAMFYLFSDGYQDQFGGEKRKKFMITKMRQLFLDIHQKDMQTQKEILGNTIENWIKTGNEKQTDDILVWGLKI
ncbi:MAG: hypothetical protein EAZ85_11435 [Bacteroidetes bacterium]|nr:MAG: hypothetical protein EAZ85_11435 [Bacteroidota bacterium]TAG89429.1 MAG: hypothetical protein EAZ20_06520 [Bacteroidota bacterium]